MNTNTLKNDNMEIKMSIEDEIASLYEMADEKIYSILENLEKEEIEELANYFERHDLVKNYELCNFLRDYVYYAEQ